MALSIKNDEVERLAREIAGRRKVSITEAIRVSLVREAERVQAAPKRDAERLRRDLAAIAARVASLPIISDLSEDEILGYDEHGIPSR